MPIVSVVVRPFGRIAQVGDRHRGAVAQDGAHGLDARDRGVDPEVDVLFGRFATAVFRAGWQWAAARGPAELAGPDDPLPGLDAGGLRQLLPDSFHAAGGQHSDLDEYDRVMAAERRTTVLVTPERITTNRPQGSS